MIDDILTVTSFSADMYAVSGKPFIDSWREVRQPGRLMVCAEGMDNDRPNSPEYLGMEWYRLDQDPFLLKWLHDNRDAIPRHLGGTTEQCQCKDAHLMHSKHHKRGCYWQWMNRNASRWFRKVAALVHVIDLPNRPNFVLWVDADSTFVKPVTGDLLRRQLGTAGVFYFKGHRPAVESGLLCFNINKMGALAIDTIRRRYVSKEYRRDERWDDGFQWGRVFRGLNAERPGYAKDLVHPTELKGVTNHVIPETLMGQYITHDKGRHSRGAGAGIMT